MQYPVFVIQLNKVLIISSNSYQSNWGLKFVIIRNLLDMPPKIGYLEALKF